MKSPLYILTFLLPLATELVSASPTAEPDFDALEMRAGGGGGSGGGSGGGGSGGGSGGGGGGSGGGGGGGGSGGGKNPCRIDHNYWYWRYPCDQSDRTTEAHSGDKFSASCWYKNWYKTDKGWAHNFDKPSKCHGDWEKRRC
ncbi:hypothetical protein N7460_004067 [Penicillium canescens]|uniref:Uncharacterized protein n=1 Tax=Penicillium canescens TaxID=5083 RepID=A0AAD6II53_PENCN|nr:hypothetical protein N7444_012475 [Penicillium canescens]KAJ6047920.1 hypothetical protein N7460_004067 [Penicillium canescens]